MREGHEKQAWNHTALVALILAKANSDPKRKLSFADFHPYESRKANGRAIMAENIADMKTFLPVDKR